MSSGKCFGSVEPMNGASDVAAVTEGVDEFGEEVVGVAEEGEGGGEERVGE